MPMFKRSLAAALMIVGALAGASLLPALAQTPPMLSLNQVLATPADARNTWRLTLEFGRADRSPTAASRSVHAPALMPHDIIITNSAGIAAPFIVRAVTAPSGNTLTVLVEYFGGGTLNQGDIYTLSIQEAQTVDSERASAAFDFLPPALDATDG